MIKSFGHRGLKRFYERGDRSQIHPDLIDRIETRLARLDVAQRIQDMSVRSYRLHPLRGDLKGYWSVTVSGNWRIIFRFEGGNAFDVNLVDYH